MEFLKQALEFAIKSNVPSILVSTIQMIKQIKEAAARVPHIMSEADKAELDQIHVDALGAADRLDAAIDCQLNN